MLRLWIWWVISDFIYNESDLMHISKCQACLKNELDLSEGLFTALADPSVGVIYGDWEYASDAAPSPTPTPTSTYVPPPPPPPPPTSTYAPPPPTTTYKPPPPPPTTTSTTWVKPNSTTSKSTTSTKWTSSTTSSPTPTPTSTSTVYTTSVNLSAGPVANIAVVGGVVDGQVPNRNLDNLNQAFLKIGALIAAAAHAVNTSTSAV